MTIFQKIVCDKCLKDIDTQIHVVVVSPEKKDNKYTGKAIRKHFHDDCYKGPR